MMSRIQFGLFMFLFCLILNYGSDLGREVPFEHGDNIGLAVFVGWAWYYMDPLKRKRDEVQGDDPDSEW
jgi:hypothetical protein